ncbi:helix-turn-helix domain-containing protein [Streptomyces sp. NPDC046465]|uniref:helix-turn-helix domain-containing protein n=1 Tax=Streptomyces sp. NPDC046465 TaxID=3155810 RepID=UPI0034088B57
MSIKVTNWVWARSESRNGARLVMLALADRADDTGFAWPSIDDLCERAKLSPRAVQKGIAKLVEIGELEVEEGGGRRVRNRYRIVPKPRTSDGVTGEYPSTSDGVTAGKPRTSDGVSPTETPHFATETPSFATETPSFEHGNPVISAGEPSIEPSENRQENHHNYPATKEDRLPAVRSTKEPRLPDEITRLQDAMSGAGINVPWKFYGDDMIRTLNDIQRLGIPLMVEQALKAEQSATRPIFSSRWFYDGWHAMRAPVALDTPGGNVVRLQHQPLVGTDAKVAGWMAIAEQLRQEGDPA